METNIKELTFNLLYNYIDIFNQIEDEFFNYYLSDIKLNVNLLNKNSMLIEIKNMLDSYLLDELNDLYDLNNNNYIDIELIINTIIYKYFK